MSVCHICEMCHHQHHHHGVLYNDLFYSKIFKLKSKINESFKHIHVTTMMNKWQYVSEAGVDLNFNKIVGGN